MKYKVGDKVRVKSLEWYNENKNSSGSIHCDSRVFFVSDMSKFCGSIFTIKDIDIDLGAYNVEENIYYWTDNMLEGLVESNEKPVVFENIVFPNENYADKVELCLGNDYEIVVEDGRTFVQKKKPKYPTNHEECCQYLGYNDKLSANKLVLFSQLINARNAYWKIAGEEMGLDKSWEPDWTDNYQKKWLINFYQDEINLTNGTNVHFVLVFPTKEMRDAFYENFKELIEECKELL